MKGNYYITFGKSHLSFATYRKNNMYYLNWLNPRYAGDKSAYYYKCTVL